MSNASTRQQKRAPVTLKIKFKSSTLDQFVERYSVDISQGGIFIRTKSPLEVGTPLRFEFQLKNATPLITGEGTVVWTREYDPSRTGLAPGMGVRFDRLPPESQQVLAKILEQKKARPSGMPTRRQAPVASPEEFVDSPTKVAPRAMIAGLADTSRETFPENDHVPVDAFEEATKVGLLDELVARTAEPDLEEEPILTSAPHPQNAPIGVAVDDISGLPAPLRASARPEEGLPAPLRPSARDDDPVVPPDGFDDEVLDLPAPVRSRPDFPESIPTELNMAPPPPSTRPADLAPTEVNLSGPSEADRVSAVNKLGAPAETLMDSVPPLPERPPPARSTPPQAAPSMAPSAISKPLAATPHLLAKEVETQVEPRGGGGSGLWIAMAVGIILLAGGGGAWWMMNRDDGATAKKPTKPAVTPETNNGKQVEKPPEKPPEPVGIEAIVSSETAGAIASLVGSDQTGPTPMTFKGLEKGVEYTVRVTAPGFLPVEVGFKGGEPPEAVTLNAKPRFLAVTSDPVGAAVYINKRRRGKTPFEIELKGPLAGVDEYKVELRRAGYDPIAKVVAQGDTWSEEAERMVAAVDLTLNKRARVVRPNNNTNGGGNNNNGGNNNGGGNDGGAGAGSGTGSDGAGAGSGSGTGSDGGGTDNGGGTGEPVPDWAKDKEKKKEDATAPPPTPAPAPKPEIAPTP